MISVKVSNILISHLDPIQINQLNQIIELGKVDYNKIKDHTGLIDLCEQISDHLIGGVSHSSHNANKNGFEIVPFKCWECRQEYISNNDSFCSQQCKEICLDHVPFLDHQTNFFMVKCYEPRNEGKPDYQWLYVKGMACCPFCEHPLQLDLDQANLTEFGLSYFGLLVGGKLDERTFIEKMQDSSDLFTKSQRKFLHDD